MTPKFEAPIALIANGPIGDLEILKNQLSTYHTIIAVDGGLSTCDKLRIRPHFIIGDMDSAGEELLAKYHDIPQKSYPTEKDETDLELAIQSVLEQGINHATLFCALKMRTDHSLYNLHLLRRYKEMLTIETDYETLFFVTEEKKIFCEPGQKISLMPLGATANGVSTTGLKWELENACIDGNFMSVSNICLKNSFSLSIKEGAVLCFLIK